VLYYQFDRQPVDVFPFVYGTVTPSSALPRSGSASYTGFVYGAGLGTGSAHAQYELQGDANANFDLATAAFTGTIRPSVTKVDFASGARTAVALGDLSLSGGVAPSRSEFNGNIAYSGGNVGNLIGNFFGPNAEEIGATMKFDLGTNAGLPEATAFVGTLSGKKN
jgi:hypothetical protein